MVDLEWPDCRNVRDVGGLPAADGRTIRPGALVRADRLGALTPDGLAAVRALGVTRVLDLRSGAECADDPDPFADDPIYLHHPVQDPMDEYEATLTRPEAYLRMLSLRPDLFASALAAVADAPPGAVVVHCHAGKDRTGLVVALALSLAGVSPDVITADYAHSDTGLRPVYEPRLATLDDPAARDRWRELWSSAPESMATVLKELDRRHGGAREYMATGGLTPSQARRVRDRLLG